MQSIHSVELNKWGLTITKAAFIHKVTCESVEQFSFFCIFHSAVVVI